MFSPLERNLSCVCVRARVSSSFERLFSKWNTCSLHRIQCYILQFIIQVNCLIIVRFSSKGNSLCVRNSSTICPSVYAFFVLFIQRRPAIVECHPRTAIHSLLFRLPRSLLSFARCRSIRTNKSTQHLMFYHLAHFMCVADHLRSKEMKSKSLAQSHAA